MMGEKRHIFTTLPSRLFGVGMVCYHGHSAHCVVAKRGGGPRHSCQESPLISPVISGNGRQAVPAYLPKLLDFPQVS